MIPEKYRWLIPVVGLVMLLGSPILAIWTWLGAVLALGIGLTILKAAHEIAEEERYKNGPKNP